MDLQTNSSQLFKVEYWPSGIHTTVKSWHLSIENPNLGRREDRHKISLRHGVNGHYIVIIDGIIYASGLNNPFNHRLFNVVFKLSDIEYKLTCNGDKKIAYKYTLTNLTDDCEVLDLSRTASSSLGESLPKDICIPDTRSYLSDEGTTVVMYQIAVSLNGGSTIMTERRFSEFAILDNIIRCQTEGHLLTSFPKLPSKLNSYFTLQDKTFLESRRRALEIYLKYILCNEKVKFYI